MTDTHRLWQWHTFWHSLLTEQFISCSFPYVLQIVAGFDKCPVVVHIFLSLLCAASCSRALAVFVSTCSYFYFCLFVLFWALLFVSRCRAFSWKLNQLGHVRHVGTRIINCHEYPPNKTPVACSLHSPRIFTLWSLLFFFFYYIHNEQIRNLNLRLDSTIFLSHHLYSHFEL